MSGLVEVSTLSLTNTFDLTYPRPFVRGISHPVLKRAPARIRRGILSC